MNSVEWQAAWRIYETARELPPDRQRAFVESESANPDVERQVFELLASLDQEESQPSEPFLKRTGTQVGRYLVGELLGRGGMGEVYAGRDTDLDRPVALKFLRSEAIGDPAAVKRFVREAKAASALNHPNILTIHEVIDSSTGLAIAMELVDGASLREFCGTPLPLRKVADFGRQIASALAAAHEHGIVHRDIKPENLMARPDGYIKVLDFGLARDFAGGDANGLSTDCSRAIGTPKYMSPEQLRTEPLTGATDVFALGIVLYELASGSHPFPGVHAWETAHAIDTKNPASPKAANPSIPREVDSLILAMLAKAPEARPSAREVEQRLAALRESPPSEPPIVWQTIGRRLRVSKRIKLAVGAVVLIAASLSAWKLTAWRHPAASAESIQSIAVLPFVNFSHNPDDEYLVDGMTDNLITDLAQSTPLRVISRTSVMQYKGASRPLPEIARALKVDAVVEGSLVRYGGRVRITAQLLNAPIDRHIWAQTYDREESDLLSIQAEVTRDISRAISAKLSTQGGVRPGHGRTTDPAAYDDYLRGRFFWSKRTEDGHLKALEYFQQAIQKDPNYALAYAGLADVYLLLGESLTWPREQAFPKARQAAEKALQLDGDLAEAHASLGALASNEWRWADAEPEYRRALELRPGYATARQWYGEYLANIGRIDDAVVEMRRAQELDPVSLITNTQVGWILTLARRYDEAIAQLRNTVDLDPSFPPAHTDLGLAYGSAGRWSEAVAEFQKAAELQGSADNLLFLAWADAHSGKLDRARQIVETVRTKPPRGPAALSVFALAYLALGQTDSAFAWLRKGCEHHSLAPIKVYPPYDPIRADPRFAAVVRCMGLSP